MATSFQAVPLGTTGQLSPNRAAVPLHAQPDSDEGPEVVDLQVGIDRAVAALARSLGMVVDLEMTDGSSACGVLGAVNAEVLILEHWGDSTQGPSGDPFTMPMCKVRRVVIP
jgi:hypothetical protein